MMRIGWVLNIFSRQSQQIASTAGLEIEWERERSESGLRLGRPEGIESALMEVMDFVAGVGLV